MITSFGVLLATMTVLQTAGGFLHFSHRVAFQSRAFSATSARFSSRSVPSVEELSTDPFGKQVSHASTLVPLLTSGNDDPVNVTDLLNAQLSHSDGIRGFFVTYLTGEGSTVADHDTTPKALLNAMASSNVQDLVPLACMNVVMPTAMTTLHTDSSLSAASKSTAKRGKTILDTLMQNKEKFPLLEENCAAIIEAARRQGSDNSGSVKEQDKELVEYWKRFFENYGYGPQQLNDICSTFQDVCN